MHNPEPTYLLIRETDYTYDDYEELVSADTTYAYDADGRLIEKIVTEYDLDERDEDEAPLSVFRKERYERDAAGNAVKRLVYDETGALSRYVTAEYDPRGHKTRECYFKPDGSLIDCFVYEYDDAGRHVRREWRKADDTLRDYHTWAYDDAGRVIEEAQGSEDGVAREIIRYEYDVAGRQVKRLTYNRDGALTQEQQYTYDTKGQPIEQVKRVRLHTGEWDTRQAVYEHDAHGRTIAVTWRTDTGLLLTRDVYEYDAHGNKVKAVEYIDEDDAFPNFTVYEYRLLNEAATPDIAWMQRNFPPDVAVPEALAQLCAYSVQAEGELSCDFVLTDSGRKYVLAGFDNVAEAADQFVIFGHDGAHSLYGYWRYAGQALDESPIVYLDGEGCDCTVLANTLPEFFTLLALGESLLGALEGWGAWDEECDGLEEFRAWLKQTFAIDPPSFEEARAIIARAKAAHPDLDAWVTAWAEQHYENPTHP